MLKRVYIEISNLCNLRCSFCPGTRRAPGFMTPADFSLYAEKLRPFTRFLYFHIMGEPLLHPALSALLRIAGEMGFRVVITTNGTLLRERETALLSSDSLHRVNISLQAFEGNGCAGSLEQYIDECAAFAKKCASGGKLCSLRLWNAGGAEEKNNDILALLHRNFPASWAKGAMNETLQKNVFLERAERFDWPELHRESMGNSVFCHALREQAGVLCDGTVVPCCLDHEGDIALGNLRRESMEEILSSPRAAMMLSGFSRRAATEELCRKCGYARRF